MGVDSIIADRYDVSFTLQTLGDLEWLSPRANQQGQSDAKSVHDCPPELPGATHHGMETSPVVRWPETGDQEARHTG
jgi:hypothetical protein